MRTLGLRSAVAIGAALLVGPVMAVAALAAGGGQSGLAAVRNATAAFHDIEKAKAAGYVEFYLCTDEAGGAGAMGQHYVNLSLVGNPAIDPVRPEALVYEPRPGGGYRLVGVEWVTFQAAWHEANGPARPTVLGTTLKPVDAPNRYGLDPFYQRHAWIWAPNPRGMFDDWNSRVSCRGQGDPA